MNAAGEGHAGGTILTYKEVRVCEEVYLHGDLSGLCLSRPALSCDDQALARVVAGHGLVG